MTKSVQLTVTGYTEVLVSIGARRRVGVSYTDPRRLSSDHNGATDAPPIALLVWSSKSAEEHLGLRKQLP